MSSIVASDSTQSPGVKLGVTETTGGAASCASGAAGAAGTATIPATKAARAMAEHAE